MPRNADPRPILLTGATGFVGAHLYPALVAAGCAVRCASRSPEAARQRLPRRRWVALDVEQPHTLQPAMEGCRAAYFLVHRISGRKDYLEREVDGARDFAAAAAAAGLERIVYVGAVEPAGEPSRHLRARLETGRVLRAGGVPTAELRAAMILGAGGASWEMVHQLARRLPAMLLPRWLRNRSQPVLVDDIVVALVAALDLPAGWNGWLDVPGPTVASHRDLLRRVAEQMGYRPPLFDVPVLSPRLSSYWIGLVTSADLALAKELVEGLISDLLPSGESVWDRLPGHRPVPLDEAIALALADHGAGSTPTPATEARIGAAVASYRAGPPIDGRPPRHAGREDPDAAGGGTAGR